MSRRVLLASFGNFDGSQYEDYDPRDEPSQDDVDFLESVVDNIGAAEQLILAECKDEPNVWALLGIPEGDDIELYL